MQNKKSLLTEKKQSSIVGTKIDYVDRTVGTEIDYNSFMSIKTEAIKKEFDNLPNNISLEERLKRVKQIEKDYNEYISSQYNRGSFEEFMNKKYDRKSTNVPTQIKPVELPYKDARIALGSRPDVIMPDTIQLMQKEAEKQTGALRAIIQQAIADIQAGQANRPQRPEGAPPIPPEILDDMRKEQMALRIGPRGYPAPGLPVDPRGPQKPKGPQSKKPRDLLPFEPRAIIQQAITRLQADKTNLPGIYDMFPPEQTPAARPQDGDPDFIGPPSSLKNPLPGQPEMVDGIPVFQPGAFVQQGIPQTNSSQKPDPSEQTPWSPPNLGYENPLDTINQNISYRQSIKDMIDQNQRQELAREVDASLRASAEEQRQKNYDKAIAEMPGWVQSQQKTGTSLSPQKLQQIYVKNRVLPYSKPQDEWDSSPDDPWEVIVATPFVPNPVKAELRSIGINDDGTVFPGPEEINRQAKEEGRYPVYTTEGKVAQDAFGGPADPNWRWDAYQYGGYKGLKAAIDNWSLKNPSITDRITGQRFSLPPTPKYITVHDPYTGFQKTVIRGSALDPDRDTPDFVRDNPDSPEAKEYKTDMKKKWNEHSRRVWHNITTMARAQKGQEIDVYNLDYDWKLVDPDSLWNGTTKIKMEKDGSAWQSAKSWKKKNTHLNTDGFSLDELQNVMGLESSRKKYAYDKAVKDWNAKYNQDAPRPEDFGYTPGGNIGLSREEEREWRRNQGRFKAAMREYGDIRHKFALQTKNDPRLGAGWLDQDDVNLIKSGGNTADRYNPPTGYSGDDGLAAAAPPKRPAYSYPDYVPESIVYTILNGDYFKAKNNIRKTLNENILTIVNKIMTTLSEEIVNPKNKGRMTKQDIRKRDRLADKVDAEPIKGNDKKINAKHRLATYIILKSKGKKD